MNKQEVPDGIVMLQGHPHPTWPYVLNKMHQAGLLEIGSELIQIPNSENGNVAIVKATVILRGDPENLSFTAYGDASPGNVKSNMVGAIIRLAETRAKGRAGRDSVNMGEALAEEMPDLEEPAPRQARPATEQRVKHAIRCAAPGCSNELTAKELQVSRENGDKLVGNVFCSLHLKEAAEAWRQSQQA